MTEEHFFEPNAAYIHIPFCVSKCIYCDFNSYPGMESLHDRYVRALITEIEQTAAGRHRPLDSVYIGGGTPTVLSTSYLCDILTSLKPISKNAEITLEANPGTVDKSKFVQLYDAEFNRLSIGVQSLDDDYLSILGRAHNVEQAVEAYMAARNAGFDNISIDLIFALPGQSINHWKNTLDAALQLEPEHISLYELTVEEGTRLADLCAQGDVSLPDEDLQIEMYELAIARLKSAGFEHYEVSNFARPGFKCRHNQVYWRNEPYYGFGAGATSYVSGDRAIRFRDPKHYIDEMESGGGAIESAEHLTGRRYLAETLIQGLRMLDGIDLHKLTAKTCTDISNDFAKEIADLQSRGLVEYFDSHLRVTHSGLLLLNDVSETLLP
ncbi:MAG: radical SAM family heme chaperone HemW [Armatimonadota bacterium]|nr:radical SAM family heme chaperone HemW [bacterium]